MSRTRFLACLFPALAIAGCAGIDNPSANQAEIRLLHASAGTGPLSLEAGGQVVASGVNYGSASPLVRVEGGRQRLVVRAGSTVLSSRDFDLDTEHVNSLVAVAGAVQLAPQPQADTGAVSAVRANLRFVITQAENSSNPTQLNALLTSTSIATDSTLRFGIDATAPRYWSLMYFDPGRFTIKFVPLGTNGPVLAEATFDVAAGETKAVVLRRDAGGTYRVEVVVEP